MFANLNFFLRSINGYFFLEELMNHRKFPSTTLSLPITIIIDVTWSH